jgi:thiol-disulfide isomerase/thioredoxin
MLLSAALLILPLTAFLMGNQQEATAAREREYIASDFTLKDLDGNDIRLSRYRGKVVFLIFGTTWCPQCRNEIPLFKEIQSRYGPKGLVTLYIDIQESKRKAEAFAQQYALNYPTLLDSEGAVTALYGIRGVPTKILIDRNGKIICWNCRSLRTLLEQQFNTPAS